MPIQFKEENGGKILVVHANGKLTKSDYENFMPEVDRLIGQYGTLHVLVDMTAFHGWEADDLWEDIKLGVATLATLNGWRSSETSSGKST